MRARKSPIWFSCRISDALNISLSNKVTFQMAYIQALSDIISVQIYAEVQIKSQQLQLSDIYSRSWKTATTPSNRGKKYLIYAYHAIMSSIGQSWYCC